MPEVALQIRQVEQALGDLDVLVSQRPRRRASASLSNGPASGVAEAAVGHAEGVEQFGAGGGSRVVSLARVPARSSSISRTVTSRPLARRGSACRISSSRNSAAWRGPARGRPRGARAAISARCQVITPVSEEEDEAAGRDSHSEGVAGHELSGPVAERVRPRADGQAREVEAEVLGELLGAEAKRWFRFFPQGVKENRVEVAAEPPREPRGIALPHSRHGVGRQQQVATVCGREFFGAADGGAGRGRLASSQTTRSIAVARVCRTGTVDVR